MVGIDHIGVAPADFDKATRFFGSLLGLPLLHDESVPDQKTFTRALDSAAKSLSGERPRIELVRPIDGEGPIARFLEKKGSGIHHVAMRVVGIEAVIAHLVAQGVRMIDREPRTGAGGMRIAFVHPEAAGGILVELVESPR